MPKLWPWCLLEDRAFQAAPLQTPGARGRQAVQTRCLSSKSCLCPEDTALHRESSWETGPAATASSPDNPGTQQSPHTPARHSQPLTAPLAALFARELGSPPHTAVRRDFHLCGQPLGSPGKSTHMAHPRDQEQGAGHTVLCLACRLQPHSRQDPQRTQAQGQRRPSGAQHRVWGWFPFSKTTLTVEPPPDLVKFNRT